MQPQEALQKLIARNKRYAVRYGKDAFYLETVEIINSLLSLYHNNKKKSDNWITELLQIPDSYLNMNEQYRAIFYYMRDNDLFTTRIEWGVMQALRNSEDDIEHRLFLLKSAKETTGEISEFFLKQSELSEISNLSDDEIRNILRQQKTDNLLQKLNTINNERFTNEY